MKVALVISTMQIGGAERVLSHLANHWAGCGREVHLVLLSGADQPSYYQVAPEVRLHHLALLRQSDGLLDAVAVNMRRLRQMRAVLRDNHFDVVISFLTRSNILATLAARSLGAPVIVAERSSTVDDSLPLPWRLARRICYRLADRIVFQTERARAAFAASARSAVIANFVPLPPEPCAAADSNVITAAGRFVPEKGFDFLIEAFAQVAARHPAWRLDIWGDGPERRNLETLRDRLGLESRVRLPGVTPEPGAWTRSGAVFVLPSRYEGFPNALCEAMAAGHAVVASDCRFGPREIVTHGEDGLLTPVGDVGALAAALDRLLGDTDLRRSMAAAARRSIRRFAMPAVISQWDDLIRSVAGGR